jgi:hypothetical protein
MTFVIFRVFPDTPPLATRIVKKRLLPEILILDAEAAWINGKE